MSPWLCRNDFFVEKKKMLFSSVGYLLGRSLGLYLYMLSFRSQLHRLQLQQLMQVAMASYAGWGFSFMIEGHSTCLALFNFMLCVLLQSLLEVFKDCYINTQCNSLQCNK
jgi:hypothetical protein